MKNFYRNDEGYYDGTAGAAISNIIKSEDRENKTIAVNCQLELKKVLDKYGFELAEKRK